MGRGTRRRQGRAGGITAALAVAGSLLAVRTGHADVVDAPLGRALAAPRGAAADRLVGVGTDLGSVYGLTGVAGALAATGRPRTAGRVAAAGLAAWTVAQAAKPLAARPRPYQTARAPRLVAEPAGSSWPSGHTAVITAMVATLAPGLPRPARAGAAAVAAGVAWSRCYVGVHHATDVVAGAGIGLLCARAVAGVAGRRRDDAPGTEARAAASVTPAPRPGRLS